MRISNYYVLLVLYALLALGCQKSNNIDIRVGMNRTQVEKAIGKFEIYRTGSLKKRFYATYSTLGRKFSATYYGESFLENPDDILVGWSEVTSANADTRLSHGSVPPPSPPDQ